MFENIQSFDKFMSSINKCNSMRAMELLLKRLCLCMSQEEEELTNDEKCKIANALSLDIKEIDFFTLTLTTVFLECVYHVAKPNMVFKVNYSTRWLPTSIFRALCINIIH